MALSATLSETGNLMVLERRERLRETLAFEKPLNVPLQLQALMRGLQSLL